MNIGFLGFGEAASVFAADLQRIGSPAERFAFDKYAGEKTKIAAQRTKTCLVSSLEELVSRCDIILSLVTGSAALAAAQEIAACIPENHLFIDCNSISPEMKYKISEAFVNEGKDMVDCAVMGSVPENGLKVSMLVAGKRANLAEEKMKQMGFQISCISDRPGDAAAVKMVRSVFAKGLEALFMEMLLAGKRYGVQDLVISSVCSSIENKSLRDVMNTLFKSEVQHAKRKMREMQYVMQVLEDVNLPPIMSTATMNSYQWLLSLNAPQAADFQKDTYLDIVDKINALIPRKV